MPATIPVLTPIVPTAGVLLLHAPKDVASDKLVVRPWHTLNVPVIGAGLGLTVNVTALLLDTVVLQPNEFVIWVIVTVCDPAFGSTAVVNVPVAVPMVSTAVRPEAVLAPPRL